MRRRTGRAEIPRRRAPPTLAEVQEIQQRLTALGFDTGGTDGRVGTDTMQRGAAISSAKSAWSRPTAMPA